jgi:hypothetical protein
VFFMVATAPGEPFNWSMSVHIGTDEHDIYDFAPEYDHFFRMFNPSSVTDLGPWPQEEHLHLFEVRFDNIALLLEPYLGDEGVYWFSCAGHLRNYPNDRAYWATSGDGVIHGDMGYSKRSPRAWPGWEFMTVRNLPPSDFAMRIEGVPLAQWRPTTDLRSFEVTYGRDASGGLGDIRDAGDGRVVSFKSNPGRRDGQKYYLATIVTRHRCRLDDPDVLDVNVTARVERIFLVPTAYLWLRNRVTGEYDLVGTHSIYLDLDTWPFRDIPAAHYLDENNEIELKFEIRAGPLTHPEERFTYFFHTHIDRVQIDARRVN